MAVALHAGRGGFDLGHAAPVLGGLSLGIGGAVLTLLDPRSVIGRLLCWSAGIHGLAQVASALAGSVEGRKAVVATSVGDWTWPLFVVPLLTLLPLVFPDHRLPGRRWRAWMWVSVMAMVLLLIGNATAAEYQLGAQLPANPWSVPYLTGPASLIGVALWAAASGAGALALALRWKRGDADARTRLALVGATLAVLIFGYALEPLLPRGSGGVIGLLAPVAIVLALAVATLRHGLFAGELALRRVHLYGLAMCGIALAYLALLAVLVRVLVDAPAWLAVVASLGLTLGLLEPARRWVRHRVRAQLLGPDPLTALTRLREVTERVGDPAGVLYAVAAEIQQCARTPGARVVVRNLGEDSVTAQVGELGSDVLALPLVHLAEDLGRLEVAARGPREPWSSADRDLLRHLAAEAARTVSVLASRSELALLRVARLTTYDDTRARLGRDLHDTLGPVLAGTYLAAEGLGLRLGPTTDEGERALGIALGVRKASGHVRAMIERLQGRDDLEGRTLLEAVEDTVADYAGTLRVEVDIEVGELSAEVARAAYLIIGEALTNAARHSGSPTAHVHARIEGTELRIRVRDHGTLGTYVAGVGIRSMRLRAAEVGGSLHVTSDPTEVIARLPLEAR